MHEAVFNVLFTHTGLINCDLIGILRSIFALFRVSSPLNCGLVVYNERNVVFIGTRIRKEEAR